MGIPAIMDIRIFHFLLIWYDRAWQFVSKKYNFILRVSFCLQNLTLKLEKLRQPVTKYIETTTFWWVFKLHRDHAADKLLTHNIVIGVGEGGVNGAIFTFLRENPNKLCFIELSQNFCDWLQRKWSRRFIRKVLIWVKKKWNIMKHKNLLSCIKYEQRNYKAWWYWN